MTLVKYSKQETIAFHKRLGQLVSEEKVALKKVQSYEVYEWRGLDDDYMKSLGVKAKSGGWMFNKDLGEFLDRKQG
jgi:hypothetical protein